MKGLTIFVIAASVAFATPAVLAQKQREISIGLQGTITSMDPHYHNLSPNNSLHRHVYEPLIAVDSNGKLTPALATSWKAVNDTTWEFKLRKNVKFHDGTPFTAEAFASCSLMPTRATSGSVNVAHGTTE